MDTTRLLQLPDAPRAGPGGRTAARRAAAPAAPAPPAGFVGHAPAATEEDWDAVLDAAETLRFAPGQVVLRAGERDRAFYLLLDGQLEVDGTAAVVAAPATLGVAAFLDGAPRAGDARGRHRTARSRA